MIIHLFRVELRDAFDLVLAVESLLRGPDLVRMMLFLFVVGEQIL